MIENPMIAEMDRHLNERENYPICPLCETDCETIYIADDGEIVGCENCVSKKDSWEWAADLKKAEQDEKEYWQERKYEEMMEDSRIERL